MGECVGERARFSSVQSRQAFADTQASYEDKIEHYELDKAQAATTITDMTEDMAALLEKVTAADLPVFEGIAIDLFPQGPLSEATDEDLAPERSAVASA